MQLLSLFLLLVLLAKSSAIKVPQAWTEYIKGLLDKYEKTSRSHGICNICGLWYIQI